MANSTEPNTSNSIDESEEITGYAKLAKLLSLEPETAILRRFEELNMPNILRLQAELHDME
jgi:hypothetical protein